MSAMAFVGPVKDVSAAREFATAVKGPRRAEYVASQRRAQCVRERVFLSETPNGVVSLVYREGVNAHMAAARMRASSNAFDRFYLESIAKIAGVNVMSLPPGPPPHLAFEWTMGERARNCTMMTAPVPDVSKFWGFCREITGRFAEHTESRQRLGIVFEQAFYLHEAKMAVVYIEGSDPFGAHARMLESTSTYDRFFVDQMSEVHGADLRKMPVKAPELLVLFDA